MSFILIDLQNLLKKDFYSVMKYKGKRMPYLCG